MPYEDNTNEQPLSEVEKLRQQVENLQATLRLRQQEVDALLGVAPHPVVARFDRDLRHTYVNAAVKLGTGIPPENYIGKTSSEMGMVDPLLARWETTLRKVFQTGVEESIEYSASFAGRKWVFHSRVVPEFDEGGAVDSLLAITRDISKQREAEEALLENVEVLETVHSLGQVLSGELDMQKLVQVVTDAATELSGAQFGSFFYNLLDEHGESYTLFTLSGVPREHFSQFPMPRNTDLFGPTFRGEGVVRIADVHQDARYGKNSPYYGMPKDHLPVTSYLAVPVISRAGEVLGGLFFGHPEAGIFTERDEKIIEGLAAQAAVAMDNARLYREAHAQRERLQITLASIGDAVIATDRQGRITFMNGIAQALTAWMDTDAIGKPLETVFRIVNEYTRATAENPVTKVIREGGVVGLANHTVLLARDGREVPIDDSGAPIRGEDGELIGVILVFRDIALRRQSEQRINLLLELSEAFSQALTSKQIADVMVEQGLKALGANVGTVALLVENGTALEILNLHGLSQETFEKYRRTPLDFSGPLNDAVRSDSTIWLESDKDYLEHYPHFAEAIKANGSRATICMPLKINERIIGGFNLSFPFDKPYDADEEAFFVALAQQCAQSLERARLYEAERKARTEAEALREILVALSGSLDVSEVFDQILANIDKVVQHDVADIMLLEDGIAHIIRSHRYAQHGLVQSEAEMLDFRLKLDDAYYPRWVFEHQQPVIIYDTETDDHWMKIQEPNLDLIRSMVIVPIKIDEKITGFLNVNSLTPHFYKVEDGARLQAFADQAAVAIKNAQAHQHAQELATLEERQRIARDLHDAVSQTLFSANLIAETLPRTWEREPGKGLQQTRLLHQLTRGAAAEMRVLLVELRPESVVSAHLEDLLTQLGYAMPGRNNIDISVIVRGNREHPLPADVQMAFYRIAQESLNNIIKHGQAARARIRFVRTQNTITLAVTDNGRGFDVQNTSNGIGLKSMSERASSISATFHVTSTVGLGTRVKLVWPVPGQD
ncbi:MAG: GAF domain-containing protein [Chloroflexota bacterium]